MLSFKLPKNDQKYMWTNHVKDKMIYYRISESLIKRIVRFPKRKEIGVAPNTVAVMQPTGAKKPQEIWVMYQEVTRNLEHTTRNLEDKGGIENSPGSKSQVPTYELRAMSYKPKVRIISAWRYPGISKPGKPIPIPDEILQEIEALIE